MYLEKTYYHKFLRVSALIVACVLVFESGLLTDRTKNLSESTHSYLANAIGVSVGVAPTELNKYTAELTQKEQELIKREAAISEREISVNLKTGETEGRDTTVLLLSAILTIMLILIVLNYVMDYLRYRKSQVLLLHNN